MGPQYEDGYNNYPPNPVRSVVETPGSGGSVTAFVQPLQAPPTPLEQNPAWQEVNRQLGAQFNFNMVPVADYRAKLTSLMAGTDLPDLISVFRGINGIANLPPFLSAQCADLSPYLPDIPNYAKTLYDVERALIPIGLEDPSLGLSSPTGVQRAWQLT